MKLSISATQARRFLLTKQLLLPPRSLSGKRSVEEVFQHLRIIQYDPLNPCGRNPDLVLQSRIADYHPDQYQDWLYKEKKGIECYDKELCIIPIEDFALTDHGRVALAMRHDRKQFLRTYQKQIEALLQRIEKEGEISSADIKDTTRVESGWGTEALFGRIALENLWRMGRLVISRREKGRKYYDLPTKVHSSFVDKLEMKPGFTKAHVRRRLSSVGLLPASGGGGGWQGLTNVRKIIREMVSAGELVEVAISGISRMYVIEKNDADVLKNEEPIREKTLSFIAPLDNLLWDRQMIHELFDFYYRWEVYTPLSKRVYGYYVLPMLYGDAFVGRIEPVFTKDRQLVIKGFWQEDKKLWDKKVWDALSDGLKHFTSYLSAANQISSHSLR